ncbi:transcription initiation factor IIB-2-like [Triticum dicoccoides]|uniref:transcription initiation factor IIB-2-like n=1 Tax=Triticum dicoccoides TaxID=85692 RepID=UPI00189028A5|nr:transcription initiation factor IIB-2-like [Triticum dicoccoides]
MGKKRCTTHIPMVHVDLTLRLGPVQGLACLAIACRSEGSPRSINELASATAEGSAARRETAKLTARIRKHLGEEGVGLTGVGVVRASNYLCHFGKQLGMSGREVASAKEAARRLEEDDLGMRNTGESIAAGIVCMVLEHGDDNRPVVSDVAKVTGVSMHTIQVVCKKLRPHAEMLFE